MLGGNAGYPVMNKHCWEMPPQTSGSCFLPRLPSLQCPGLRMDISGRVGIAAGCVVSSTHLCICILGVRVTNSCPPYSPVCVLSSCSIPNRGS